MLTTRTWRCADDPVYEQISRRFHENPDEFADAFARAWFKLTHRDMGPKCPLPGPGSAGRRPDLAGPDSRGRSALIDEPGHRRAEGQDPGHPACRVAELVTTAWASASTFRGSDKRGGANGARIRLAPQKDWEVNEPDEAGQGAEDSCEGSRQTSTRAAGGKKVSLADLIVLGGCAAVEKAAKDAGMT